MEPESSTGASFPNEFAIEFVHDRTVKATMHNDDDGTVVVHTHSKNFRNLFEATIFMFGKIADPWTSWVAADQNAKFTPWRYFKEVLKRHPKPMHIFGPSDSVPIDENDAGEIIYPITSSDIEELNFPQPVPTQTIVDPRTRPKREWTSELMSRWMQRPEKVLRANPDTIIPLKHISHFRRYGNGKCFEFLCQWVTPPKDDQSQSGTKRTWQKWVDLIRVGDYMRVLKATGWNMDIEKDVNWETIDTNNLSEDEDFPEDMCYRQSKEGRKADENCNKMVKSVIEHDEDSETKSNRRFSEEDEEMKVEEGSSPPQIPVQPAHIDHQIDDFASDEDEDDAIQPLKRQRRIPIIEQSSCSSVPPYKVCRMRPSRR